MSQPTINYVIATYAGKSSKREFGDKDITPDILRLHLEQLISLLPSITAIKQITITKPLVKDDYVYNEYYDINDKVDIIEKQFGIPVNFIEMLNYQLGLSYSQYRMAYKKFPQFDFYMIMEDDWVPIQEEFDILLLKAWRQKFTSYKDLGYLCLWYAKCNSPQIHAAISVGIISQASMKAFDGKYHINQEFGQYEFSRHFEEDLNTPVKDFCDNGKSWRILFWQSSVGKIYDFSKSTIEKECLLAPLHYSLMKSNEQKYQYEIVKKI